MRRSLRSFARRANNCRGAGLTQENWIVRFGILDGSVFGTPDAGLEFLILGHEDVEGDLGVPLWLAPFVLLPLATFRTFLLDHPRWPLFSYDNLHALGRLSLRWPN
jgi:hypothetical protein